MVQNIGQRKILFQLVSQIATRLRVDPKLLDAIVATESAYNPWAIRYEPNIAALAFPMRYATTNRITVATEIQLEKMSFGLAQLLGTTLRSVLGYGGQLTELFEPEKNLTLACQYLKILGNEFPFLDDQIAAYNEGPGSVKREPVSGKYKNQDYVDEVLHFMNAPVAS